MSKQFSPSCERNREPILAELRSIFSTTKRVLEIGSGSGQHAAWFAAALPHLIWQTSDLAQNHPSIIAWLEEAHCANLMPPLLLDMHNANWPDAAFNTADAGLDADFDALFTANTCHIMAWPDVQRMFAGAGKLLPPGGQFVVYGPFNYCGDFTSPSNAAFDASLKHQAPHMGIRDIETVTQWANAQGLHLDKDEDMPANNRLLVWRRNK